MSARHGRLEGRILAVTGGARGIGRAIAEVAVREGAAVAVLDHDEDQGGRTVSDLASRFAPPVVFVPVDVSDEDSVAAAFAETTRRIGDSDILINNAGGNADSDPVAMTSAEWDAVFALDLKSAWLCCRCALPGMIDAGRGSIVNIASLHATLTTDGMFPYAAAKAGLVGLTRSLALEVGPKGIRVNAVSPGYTRTPPVRDAFSGPRGIAELESVTRVHALRRIGEPIEIAEVVVFLASDDASFVTGANWAVDGGLGARFA